MEGLEIEALFVSLVEVMEMAKVMGMDLEMAKVMGMDLEMG